MSREIALNIANTPVPVPPGILNPTAFVGYLGQNAFRVALAFALVVLVILALIFIISGGIDWITSEGSKEKVEKAKAKITYAVIGLILAFLAFFILSIIGSIFGLNLLTV